MVKIVFIIYSHSGGGGAESLLTLIVNNLNPQKYDISIIEVVHYSVKKEPVNANVHILPYIMDENDPRPRQNMYDLYYNPQRVFEDYIGDNYDVYISFNYQLPSFLLPNHRKTIAWIHTSIYDLKRPGMERYLELQRGVFERTEKIVSISDITTESIVELFPEYKHKITEVLNGIDIRSIRDRAQDGTDVVLDKNSVLFVGRLEDRKCPIRLYDIFYRLLSIGKQYHLYYLGYGNLQDAIEARIKQDGLQEFVHFLGYYDNPFPIIRQAKVCCLLSTEEGFPMCLLESQALGVPFVSTSIGGVKYLSENENCGRVIQTDEEAMDAIVRFVEEKDRSRIFKCCNESIKRFGLEKYICNIENLIDGMME